VRPDHDEALDLRAAADLVARTERAARDALTIRTWPLYLAWGTAWLVGFASMWLSVRGQRPYLGPTGWGFATLGVLNCAAIVVTIVVVYRATRGVSGDSETQGRMYGLAWPIGFACLFTIQSALGGHGASPEVLGILGATGPLLVTCLIYLVGAAMWRDRSMFALGAWLAAVAMAAAWTGPVTALAVEAAAAGGGFLLTGAVQLGRERRR
jgi:phosphatidylglycerophosphate synthase